MPTTITFRAQLTQQEFLTLRHTVSEAKTDVIVGIRLNDLSAQQLQQIFETLAANPNVKRLKLYGDSVHTTALCQLLITNRTIAELELATHPHLASLLMDILAYHPSIKKLIYNTNHTYTTSQMLPITYLLTHNTALEELTIKNLCIMYDDDTDGNNQHIELFYRISKHPNLKHVALINPVLEVSYGITQGTASEYFIGDRVTLQNPCLQTVVMHGIQVHIAYTANPTDGIQEAVYQDILDFARRNPCVTALSADDKAPPAAIEALQNYRSPHYSNQQKKAFLMGTIRPNANKPNASPVEMLVSSTHRGDISTAKIIFALAGLADSHIVDVLNLACTGAESTIYPAPELPSSLSTLNNNPAATTDVKDASAPIATIDGHLAEHFNLFKPDMDLSKMIVLSRDLVCDLAFFMHAVGHKLIGANYIRSHVTLTQLKDKLLIDINNEQKSASHICGCIDALTKAIPKNISDPLCGVYVKFVQQFINIANVLKQRTAATVDNKQDSKEKTTTPLSISSASPAAVIGGGGAAATAAPAPSNP